MSAKVADRHQRAFREAHAALDVLIRTLEFDDLGRLAADLTDLADRPKMLLRILSFARTMAEHQDGVGATAPSVRLVGGGHGDLIDMEEGTRRLDAVTEAADNALDGR